MSKDQDRFLVLDVSRGIAVLNVGNRPPFTPDELRLAAREVREAIVHLRSQSRYESSLRWEDGRAHPAFVLRLLAYIDELEERAGEKDPEDG